MLLFDSGFVDSLRSDGIALQRLSTQYLRRSLAGLIAARFSSDTTKHAPVGLTTSSLTQPRGLGRLPLWARFKWTGNALKPVGNGPNPKGNDSTPEGTKTNPKGNAPTPEGTEANPKGNTSTPEGTEANPEGNASTPEGSEANPEGNASTPKGSEANPEGNALDLPIPEQIPWGLSQLPRETVQLPRGLA